MKPLRLKVKGLNSFQEEQTIDFERLTERGFFGIFGPTGSGKSSILDGITLALYGDVSRGSSNFINVNSERANVSFEFQISGAIKKRYQVDREFKLDKKSQSPRSGKCKILDITDEEPVVLADTVTTVTNKCIEVIGLSEKDFTRTVVLPQGKFSDFLRMEGKARRDMLERLFNLQEYGEDLRRKLNGTMDKTKTELHYVDGELKGYEGITQELAVEKKKQYEEDEKAFQILQEELKKILTSYEERREVFLLSKELEEYKKKQNELSAKEEHMRDNMRKLQMHEKALLVTPFIQAYLGTSTEEKQTKAAVEELKLQRASVQTEKKCAEETYETSRIEREQKLPMLTVREQMLKEAVQDARLLELLLKAWQENQKKETQLVVQAKENQEVLSQLDTQRKKNEIENEELNRLSQQLKVDTELKKKVQYGTNLNGKIQSDENIQKQLAHKIKNNKDAVSEWQQELVQVEEVLKKRHEVLKDKGEALQKLIENCPGTNEDIMKNHDALMMLRQSWEQYHEANTTLEQVKQQETSYQEVILEGTAKLELLKQEEAECKELIEKNKMFHLASILRKELQEGDACPVCGAKHHELQNVTMDSSEEMRELKEREQMLQIEVREWETKLTITKTKLLDCRESIEKQYVTIEKLGKEFLTTSVEEAKSKFDLLKKQVETYEQTRIQLEEEQVTLKNTLQVDENRKQSLRIRIDTTATMLHELTQEMEVKEQELEKHRNNLRVLIEETHIEDFEAMNQEIYQKETKKEQVDHKSIQLRGILNELQIRMDETMGKQQQLAVEFEKVKVEIAHQANQIEAYKKNIREKMGNEQSLYSVHEVETCLKQSTEQRLELNQRFQSAEQKLLTIQEQYKQCNESFIALQSKLKGLEERLELDLSRLKEGLEEQKFESVKAVKEVLLPDDISKGIRTELEQYREDVSKLQGALDTVSKKLKGRMISEDEWMEIQEKKEKCTKLVEEKQELLIKFREEMQRVDEALHKLKDLLKKREEITHKLGVLSDLDTLFKGKKFVEFVATERLEYISKEASKQLGEITNYVYGLETDDNGRFLIRDNKNGGILRDASTLSGGETFLTSLALALALSTEIQLKGTAPLELFFLDEGFGTLDDTLLEVVMSSLEKIHNDKLKVGIISHVESVKNRVPIKLIVTPAETGEGGSKVKLEIS